MPRVKFKKQFRCAPDGTKVETLNKGDVRDLPDRLAESAVKSGAGEIIDAESKPAEKKASKKASKGKKEADENKSGKPSENK